jgi:hypothetical protein
LNVYAWELFINTSDKKALAKGIPWIDLSIKLGEQESGRINPNCLDTKANLLYRMGKVKEAIAVQEEAVSLSSAADINGNLVKMKQGEPTWPVK